MAFFFTTTLMILLAILPSIIANIKIKTETRYAVREENNKSLLVYR